MLTDINNGSLARTLNVTAVNLEWHSLDSAYVRVIRTYKRLERNFEIRR